ncbi:hypothetical protein AAHH17_02295 [Lysinibacillus capsici]|uniref:Ig-like domain-containing protein n=1 Tax=Lysinibacillus capsici TaxID=2115968 RepID=UPI0032E50A01
MPNQGVFLPSVKVIEIVSTTYNYRLFSDPDGDTLSYSAVSANESIATVSVIGEKLYITPIVVGVCTITLTATDSRGAKTDMTFNAIVNNSVD